MRSIRGTKRSVLVLTLLQVAAATPPRAPSPGHEALFSYEDYPREALRNHWEGDVKLDLTVSAEGRVAACAVVQSSGHKPLDDGTCAIMLKRARFKPAEDAEGRPVEGHFLTPTIHWRIAG